MRGFHRLAQRLAVWQDLLETAQNDGLLLRGAATPEGCAIIDVKIAGFQSKLAQLV